ncbi:Uncharacterized protein FWK35_00035365, partial [Aphis craccivora]
FFNVTRVISLISPPTPISTPPPPPPSFTSRAVDESDKPSYFNTWSLSETDDFDSAALKKLEILGYNGPKNLTRREMVIASNLVNPKEITVSYNNIGGLSDVINDILKNVIIPAHKIKYKREILPNFPKRILLHGPSGCGKTMISEAITKEKGLYCLKLDGSLTLFSGHTYYQYLTDRHRKEKKKLIDALFSLARKLQPFIIFIDGF